MGSEVTHVVAEAEHAVHAAVGVATSLVSAARVKLFLSLRSPSFASCASRS